MGAFGAGTFVTFSSHTLDVSFQILSHRCQTASTRTIIQVMNTLNVLVLFAILLKCIIASEVDVRNRFIDAVERRDVGWLKVTR